MNDYNNIILDYMRSLKLRPDALLSYNMIDSLEILSKLNKKERAHLSIEINNLATNKIVTIEKNGIRLRNKGYDILFPESDDEAIGICVEILIEYYQSQEPVLKKGQGFSYNHIENYLSKHNNPKVIDSIQLALQNMIIGGFLTIDKVTGYYVL